MSNELTRRDFFGITGALGAATVDRQHIARLFRASFAHSASDRALSPDVVRGNARFQILSPTVIRMEYAPSGKFIDELSLGVVNRSWPTCSYTARDVNGWVEIATDRMTITYKLGSGPFTAETLAATWKDPAGDQHWRFGDADPVNLGGVHSLDIAIGGASGKDPGPLSRAGYSVLDDSTSAIWNPKTQWPQARPDLTGRQDLYFFVYGHDYPRLFRELTQLSGPIPMVPRYIFGAWVGDRAALPADEWKRIVQRFREEQIPMDLVVIDSLSEAAVVWSGFGWDPEQFPDPKEFFAWMKAQGVKVTVNEHYFPMTPDSDPHFEQFRAALKLPPGTTKISHDLGDPTYVKLYMDMLHKPLLDDGMAFWWQDGEGFYGPPFVVDDVLWIRHVEYEGQERITGKRTIVFCRLGGWGSHRYGAFFTGDINAHWKTLQGLVTINVSAGNSLLPYVNSLTGGLRSETIDHELYQRWMQFSAFSPLVWIHGAWGIRFPWEYDQDFMGAMRQMLQLRYRLIPYIYTQARVAHDSGLPIVRGTYLHYPEQEQAYTFTQQYLFGADFLVAPITQPGYGAPVTISVYFPAGDHWYDYFTGTIYAGGQELSYTCPLDRMPLFVRAGAILPMALDLQSSDEQPVTDPLTLTIFAGDKPNTFRLYEDDGVSLDYRKKAHAWTPITYTPSAHGDHQITIDRAEGRYAGQLSARRYHIRMHGLVAPTRVTVGTRTLTRRIEGDGDEGWVWSNINRVLTITLQPIAVTSAVTVTVHHAGVFHDIVATEYLRNFRERVRRVKVAEKVRWVTVLYYDLVKKEPHVLQVTDQVEQELNDMLRDPTGAATRTVDVQRMTAAMLTAFVTKPFDSSRKLPELDPESRTGMKNLENKTFPVEQVHAMTRDLVACQLLVTATEQEAGNSEHLVTVKAKVVHDTMCLPTVPVVSYELTWPDTKLPGWSEMSRDIDPSTTSATFVIRVLSEFPAGTFLVNLRAIVTWGSYQTVLQADVPWTVPRLTFIK